MPVSVSCGRAPPSCELQHAIAVPRRAPLQRFTNGLFQNRQLERLAQDRELRLRRLHDVTVAAGEKNGDLRVVVADLLSQGDAVHAAGHDDVAEDEIDLVAALQPVQRIGGVLRAQGPVAELLDERRRDIGDLGVVLDDEDRPLPRHDRLGGGASTALTSAAWRRGR